MTVVSFKRKPEDFSKVNPENILHWSFTPVGSAQRERSIAYDSYIWSKRPRDNSEGY